jgi:L-ascorbate metabolism protein UlaG (beta-lactamase superfamily)
MTESPLRVTYVGGPTALLEYCGLRILTDPTLDPGGTDYPTPVYTLHKTQSPAVAPADLGRIDVVLLSHDHHFDNLDHAGRACLENAGTTCTTKAGAERLGGRAVGLEAWERIDLPTPGGGTILLTAVPARHGPAGGDRGPVIGFILTNPEAPDRSIYFSGDTVWFEGVAEVARNFTIGTALLNLGAAKVSVAGPDPLTFTAVEAVGFARACARATIVPLHFEGWTHFSEGRAEIRNAFVAAGMESRLQWLEPGRPTLAV